METDLKFRPFRSPADPGWDEAWAIYQNSFPQKEIRSLEDHLQALSDPHYTADGIWSDGRLIGILYYWTAPEYVYIEHLAISPDLRGANMGSRVLEAFCRKIRADTSDRGMIHRARVSLTVVATLSASSP